MFNLKIFYNTNKSKINFFIIAFYFSFIILFFNLLNYNIIDKKTYNLSLFSIAELFLFYVSRKKSILYIASVLSMAALVFLFCIYFV
jgi:ABC-type amino acid transport system permease subunit